MKTKSKNLKNQYQTFLILILLALTTLKSTSQIFPSKDTITCLPNFQLRVAIKRLETCNEFEKELKLTNSNNLILLNRIATKDSVIKEYEKRDSMQESRYANGLIQIGSLTERLNGQKEITGIYKNIHRKERIIYAGGGFIAGVIVMLVAILIK